MSTELPDKIKIYIAERRQTKLDALNKKRDSALEKAVTADSIEAVQIEFSEKEQTLLTEFEVNTWLTNAAKRAKQISMATHALKFTHSGAKGTNILALQHNKTPLYLDTATLSDPAVDAVGNAAALDVAKLLNLESNQRTLADHLAKGDLQVLLSLAKNESQCQEWADGLQLALQDKDPSSHTLAKQVYFPIGENDYHLLSLLYSSSLAQAMYDNIHHHRYSEKAKAAREAKKKGSSHVEPTVFYPDLAVTVSGGSKPQNVSQLNSGRGGRTYLFPCSPPNWQDQNKAPLHASNWFEISDLNRKAYRPIKRLAEFLLKVRDVENNQRIRHYRERLTDEVIDTVLNMAAHHQNNPVGWSNESQLSDPQQLWLDPKNPNDDFQQHYKAKLWQVKIAYDFGQWLNHQLTRHSNKQLTFDKTTSEHWQSAFKQALQEMTV